MKPHTTEVSSSLFSRHSSMFNIVFLCLIVLVAAVMGIVWHNYRSNTNAILTLTQDLITQVNETITKKTTHYLLAGPTMVELGAGITADHANDLMISKELDDFMIQALRLHDQLAAMSVGTERGDFLMHTRQRDGSIVTKIIDRSLDVPKLIMIYRKQDGTVDRTEEQAFDGYDPRLRPWYKAAKQARQKSWSDIYIFHTSRTLGITASFPILRSGKVLGVIGVDIPLHDLSAFVAQQKIGQRGETFLINDRDEIVASISRTPLVIWRGGGLRPMRISEYPNRVLSLAWEQAEKSRRERVLVEKDSERWIASFHAISEGIGGQDWTIGLLVPEDDLIGPIKKLNRLQLWGSLSILFVAIVLGFGLARIKNVLNTQTRFIRRTFGRYLSDEIVTAILESPQGLELGGQKRTLTIVMTDLRGFTAISERMPAEKVLAMLNQYLGDMTDIIMKWDGTIDEFIGDAILVIFGAPFQRHDDAQRAVACALDMQLAMEHVNARNRENGYPPLAMGIGINTGEVVVGNVGSLKRTKYGIVGRQVNLAARIESYTRGGQTLISPSTKDACCGLLELGDCMEVRPKGFSEHIAIYEVHGIAGDYNVHLPKPPAERLNRDAN